MRAVVARGGELHMEEVPEPEPGPGQVLVAPLACGICGSDLHVLELQQLAPEEVPPLVLGHEFCVEVLDHGPGAQGRHRPGSIVVSVPFVDGPDGPELTGLTPNFPGAFAERMLLSERRLLPVPGHVDPARAALTEPLAVGFHAVAAADLAPGDVALVVGCGPVGLSVIAGLKARGHGPVVASDFSPVRRRLAEAAGADVVLDPAAGDPFGSWVELAGAPEPPSPLLLQAGRPGRSVVFECVGVPGLLQQVIDGAPQHARVVVVGVCAHPDQITPVTAITKELSLTFVFAYRPEEFEAALRAIADGVVDVEPWVTGTFGLERASEAVRALARPDEHGKVLVTPA